MKHDAVCFKQSFQCGTLMDQVPARQKAQTPTCTCTRLPCSAIHSDVVTTNWYSAKHTSTTKNRQVRFC